MFCPNCKHYAGKGHEFCNKCGAFVPADDSDTFRYAGFNISGADRQRVATRNPDNAVRDEAARERAGAPGRTGQYTQNKAPVNRQGANPMRPVQMPVRTAMPPISAPVLRPSPSGQAKNATGCAPVVIISIIIIGMIIIFPQIMRVSGSEEDYYDQTAVVSVEGRVFPDETAHCYMVDAAEIADVTIEMDKTVTSFTLTPDAFTSYSGEDFPLDLALKGSMFFTDGTALDVYCDGGSVYTDDCSLKTNTRYDIQNIRLLSDDREKYYILFTGEQEIMF